jgi:hypothetical protein
MALETFTGIFVGMMFLMALLGIAWLILLIWSLVHLLKANNDPTWKILWVLVIVLIPFIGVILYYFIGRDQTASKRRRK